MSMTTTYRRPFQEFEMVFPKMVDAVFDSVEGNQGRELRMEVEIVTEDRVYALGAAIRRPGNTEVYVYSLDEDPTPHIVLAPKGSYARDSRPMKGVTITDGLVFQKCKGYQKYKGLFSKPTPIALAQCWARSQEKVILPGPLMEHSYHDSCWRDIWGNILSDLGIWSGDVKAVWVLSMSFSHSNDQKESLVWENPEPLEISAGPAMAQAAEVFLSN